MFKPHKSICSDCGKETIIVVKKMLCNICNKQQKKKNFGKSPIKKYSYIKPKTGEADLFYIIWIESNQCCFVCDKPIIYPVASNFAHILPKALNKYPLFKLHKPNIKVFCHDNEGSCHMRWDKAPHSTLTEAMWQKVFELEVKLKDEYKYYKNKIIKNKS